MKGRVWATFTPYNHFSSLIAAHYLSDCLPGFIIRALSS